VSTSRPVIYRDLVHGPVAFVGKEAQLLNTAEMTRLREIKQLSTVYLFHPYATHTRFHHSAGVAWLAKFFLGALPLEHLQELELTDQYALVAAALLHDIGHSAWSHVGEEFAKYRGETILHDARSRELVLGRDTYDEHFERWNGLPRVRDVLDDQTLRQKVAELIVGNPPISSDMLEGKSEEKQETIKRHVTNRLGWMGQLIHSVFDLDRADYLMRDAFFTFMSSQALVDPANLVQKTGFRMVGKRKSLVFCDLPFAESFVTSYELMYPSVYLEAKNLVAEELLIRALCEVYPEGTPIDRFWFATDEMVLAELRTSSHPLVRRVIHLMLCCRTYDIVRELPFSSLDVHERENITYLSQSRQELLQVEREIAHAAKAAGASIETYDFLLAIWHWKVPLGSKAWIDIDGDVRTVGEVSPLLEALQSERYAHRRSRLVIAISPHVSEHDRGILCKEALHHLSQASIGA